MIRVKKIEKIENYSIWIRFSNDELRILNVRELNFNNHNNTFIQKLFNPEKFPKVSIGNLGQICWSDIAEMKNIDGNVISCEFDMSPEYVYASSIKYEKHK